MAHLFETGFMARQPAWHGLGVVLPDAVTSAEAIKYAGLDWSVHQEPMYLADSDVAIPGVFANVRSSDRSVLGITTGRYKIVQNSQAFEFVDNLLMTKDVLYETAGSLAGGKTIWLLARLSEAQKILDDITQPYVLFMNSHTGKGSTKALLTTVRVVCNNTLSIALKEVRNIYKIRHVGNIKFKIDEAQRILGLNKAYHAVLKKRAEALYKIKVSSSLFDKYLETLFPVRSPDRAAISRIMAKREGLKFVYQNAPDIKNYAGTGYGVLCALTDWYEHFSFDKAKKSRWANENHMKRVLDPTNWVYESIEKLEELVAA